MTTAAIGLSRAAVLFDEGSESVFVMRKPLNVDSVW